MSKIFRREVSRETREFIRNSHGNVIKERLEALVREWDLPAGCSGQARPVARCPRSRRARPDLGDGPAGGRRRPHRRQPLGARGRRVSGAPNRSSTSAAGRGFPVWCSRRRSRAAASTCWSRSPASARTCAQLRRAWSCPMSTWSAPAPRTGGAPVEGGGREAYGAATARALAPLATLVEYAAPLLCVGGTLVAWKGARDHDEERRGSRSRRCRGVASSRRGSREALPGQP